MLQRIFNTLPFGWLQGSQEEDSKPRGKNDPPQPAPRPWEDIIPYSITKISDQDTANLVARSHFVLRPRDFDLTLEERRENLRKRTYIFQTRDLDWGVTQIRVVIGLDQPEQHLKKGEVYKFHVGILGPITKKRKRATLDYWDQKPKTQKKLNVLADTRFNSIAMTPEETAAFFQRLR